MEIKKTIGNVEWTIDTDANLDTSGDWWMDCEIDWTDSTITFSQAHNSQKNSMNGKMFDGRSTRIPCADNMTHNNCESFVDCELADFIEKWQDKFDTKWDGSNWVGIWGEDNALKSDFCEAQYGDFDFWDHAASEEYLDLEEE